MSSSAWPATFDALSLPVSVARRIVVVTVLGVLLLVIGVIAGCASGPVATQPGKSSAAPRPGTADRDGAPSQPPPDLIKVPNAKPRVEVIRQGGPNKPYVVLGQGYEPLADDVPFKQRGLASWYGSKFHGRRTASGEVYSMYGMTAAHRTLPIPSYARIRETRSGKAIIVRINDRGPFHSSRVLDLSYTAALKLGVLSRGSAEVEIERLTFEDIRTGRWRSDGDEDDEDRRNPSEASNAGLVDDADPILALAARLEQARPQPAAATGEELMAGSGPIPPVPDVQGEAEVGPSLERRAQAYTPASKGYWVQLAAFRQRQGVDDFQKRVAQEMDHLAPLLAVYQDGGFYRLQAGPYGQRDAAQGVARRMRDVLRLEPVVVERR